MGAPAPFRAAFSRWAGRVRARLAAHFVLTGAAVGLALGAVASGAAWYFRFGSARPAGAALGVLGAAVGLFVARRRRFSDVETALYLDARLASNEVIATAVAMERASDAGEDPARAVVIQHASEALATATSKRVRPRMWSAVHALLPVAAAGIVYVSLRPLPPAPAAPPPPPGVARVQLADVAGLERIERLAAIDGRDEAQRERLKNLANEAKKLRDKLKDGMEKREAQAEIARLKDGITAERLSLGDGEQRAGLEAAQSKLGENPNLKNAQKALGDRDLVSFDEEMERLANKLEKEDRELAKKTLEEAAEAAKKQGAKDVARELERQKELLEERGQKRDKVKELAKALGDSLGNEGKQALKDAEGSGSRKDMRNLEKHLEEALEKMTPEERKRLQENLKKKMAKQGGDAGDGPSKEQMKELLRQLDTEEGQKQLEDELKKMAEDDEAKRQEQLDDAQEGAGEAEGQINGAPIPMPMEANGDGKGEKGKSAGGKDQDKGGEPNGGHSEDPPSKADHEGLTGVIQGGEMKARANAKINKAKPMPGVVMGRASGRPGETANVQGSGAIGKVGPGEVGGIERSEVPEEYREQVGRYFQPK
jgi:hypothetical protein